MSDVENPWEALRGLRSCDFGPIFADHLSVHAGSLFRMGLSSHLELYTFHLVQATKGSAQELTIDDMMAALVNHYKKSQCFEDTKAFAVNFRDRGKKSASGEKAKFGLKSGKNAPAATRLPTPGSSEKDRGSKQCDHCGSEFHGKEKCYYLHPDLRPDG